MYAARADAFYKKVLRDSAPPPPPRPVSKAAPDAATILALQAVSGFGAGSVVNVKLRLAAQTILGQKRTMWDHFFSRWAMAMSSRKMRQARVYAGDDEGAADHWAMLQAEFRKLSREAMRSQKDSLTEAVMTSTDSAQARHQKMEARKLARGKTKASLGKSNSQKGGIGVGVGGGGGGPRERAKAHSDFGTASLKSQWASVWDERYKPVTPAWGGLGFKYDDKTSLQQGWDDEVEGAAADFDRRHEKCSANAKRLLTLTEVRQTRQMNLALFNFHSNRYSVQPLRLDTNDLSPRTTSFKLRAQSNFETPLALQTHKSGGPLLPVYIKKMDTEVWDEDPEDASPTLALSRTLTQDLALSA